jgi:hypothetical protein
MSLGLPLYWQGKFLRARKELEKGIDLHATDKTGSKIFPARQDRPVMFAYAAAALWHLGYPDQALTRSHQAIALARELADPITLGVIHDFVCFLSQLRRNSAATQEHAAAANTLCTEY